MRKNDSKTFLMVALFLFFPLALNAQTLPADEAGALKALESSPRHGEWVSVEVKTGQKLNLWVVYPERSTKAPVVLVVHEIFGLSDWIRGVADRLAAEGFIAVAPDFLSGQGPTGMGSRELTPDKARALVPSLTPDDVAEKLNAAARYATGLPAAESSYGVVGFCWGGGVSFNFASQQPALKAAVVYYGPSPAKEALAAIKAPVLGLYGGNDARIGATVPPAQDEMKRLGKSYEVQSYEGAGHGFLRQLSGQNGANLRAAEKAWPKTIAFFKSHLELKTSAAGEGLPDFTWMASSAEEECCPLSAEEVALSATRQDTALFGASAP